MAGPAISSWDRSALETVAEGLDQLIDLIAAPAIAANRYQDVLAANPLARALSPGFAPGPNFLRWRLLDPAARQLYVDWDEATDVAVAGLRELAALDPGDPRMAVFIDELSSASPRFRELWARADVGYRVGTLHLRHPKVGDLYLHRNQLNVPHGQDVAGQHVLIYCAEPGSDSARELEQLTGTEVPSNPI